MEFKTALVTGASSGIGFATAKALADTGLAVHAVARRADRLRSLAKLPGIVPLVLDLRDTSAVETALSELDIDVLVNNAGTARGFGGLLKASRGDIDATIGTNVAAVYHLLRIVMPQMVRRTRGHIVNIGSTAGLYPGGSAIYGGSKGAIRMLGPNLRLELQGTGVRVTEICPGRVATEIYDAAFDDPETSAAIKKTGINDLKPEDVADAIVYALNAPQRVNVSSIEIVPTEQSYGGMHLVPTER